jgi:hypothetical protein
VTSDNLLDFVAWAVQRAKEETSLWEPAAQVPLRGLLLNVRTQNDRYAQLVDQRLFHEAVSDELRESIDIAVLSPDDSSFSPPPTWGEAIYHPREIEKQLADTPYRATYFHELHLWQIYEHRTNFGLQWMMNDRGYHTWEPGAPLRSFLHWAYRQLGWRLAHAGTLGKNSQGIVLVGRGGSGKSGTVTGGIAHGLQSVGDDYILVRQLEAGIKAYPLFSILKQDRPGLERLGLATEICETRDINWQGKYEFSSQEISGKPLADELAIRAILIPRIAHAKTTIIEPISKKAAMLALAPTGVFQMPDDRDSGVEFYSEIVRRVPCFELTLSSDPANVSQAVETFIAGGFPCA